MVSKDRGHMRFSLSAPQASYRLLQFSVGVSSLNLDEKNQPENSHEENLESLPNFEYTFLINLISNSHSLRVG